MFGYHLSEATFVLSLTLAFLFIGLQDEDGHLQIADDVRNTIPFFSVIHSFTDRGYF